MEKEEITKVLKKNKGNLSEQQYRTIKGQIQAGDSNGAYKGLMRLLKRTIKTEKQS